MPKKIRSPAILPPSYTKIYKDILIHDIPLLIEAIQKWSDNKIFGEKYLHVLIREYVLQCENKTRATYTYTVCDTCKGEGRIAIFDKGKIQTNISCPNCKNNGTKNMSQV